MYFSKHALQRPENFLCWEILKEEDAADNDQRGHASIKDCQSREVLGIELMTKLNLL